MQYLLLADPLGFYFSQYSRACLVAVGLRQSLNHLDSGVNFISRTIRCSTELNKEDIRYCVLTAFQLPLSVSVRKRRLNPPTAPARSNSEAHTLAPQEKVTVKLSQTNGLTRQRVLSNVRSSLVHCCIVENAQYCSKFDPRGVFVLVKVIKSFQRFFAG